MSGHFAMGVDAGAQPAKRGAGAMSDGDPITHRELNDLFTEFEKNVVDKTTAATHETVAGLVERNQAVVMSSCRDLFAKQSAVIESRIAPIEAAVSTLQTDSAGMARDHAALVARVTALESSMAMADSQPPQIAAQLDEEEFVWDPILARLKVNAAENVSNASVKATVVSWLEKAGFPDGWTFAGPAMGRYFHVTFSGDALTGARRAKKANLALRKPDGTWEELFCENAAKKKVALYVGPDKSPQQEAQEILAKRLLRTVEELYSEVQFSFDKKKNLVKANRLDFAVMVVKSREERAPKFCTPTLTELGIDKDAVLKKMDAGTRSHANPEDSNWAF